jgi:pyridoxine 4-dehydrogenase
MTATTAAAAGTWWLGDLVVNRMGFGAMRLTQSGHVFSASAVPSDRNQAIALLRQAVDLGVNHIDTAAFYFSALRSANELINAALSPYPDDLVIVTKVGPGRDASGNWMDAARPDQLRGQVEENLRQLGRDHLDVVNLRRMPSMTSITEHVGALAELRDAGLVRHLGISGVELADLAAALAIAPVVCVQNNYSLLNSPDPAGVDATARPAHARDTRDRQPGPPCRECRRRSDPADQRRHGDAGRARRPVIEAQAAPVTSANRRHK